MCVISIQAREACGRTDQCDNEIMNAVSNLGQILEIFPLVSRVIGFEDTFVRCQYGSAQC